MKPKPTARSIRVRADTPTTSTVRARLLERLESHFARPCVKARVVAALDIAPSLYSQVVQHVIARVFPECCDLDLEAAEEGRKLTGLIPRGGVCRVAPAHLERFAASLA